MMPGLGLLLSQDIIPPAAPAASVIHAQTRRGSRLLGGDAERNRECLGLCGAAHGRAGRGKPDGCSFGISDP